MKLKPAIIVLKHPQTLYKCMGMATRKLVLQNEAMGWIEPMGHSLAPPNLDGKYYV